jgi:hypothetical protein
METQSCFYLCVMQQYRKRSNTHNCFQNIQPKACLCWFLSDVRSEAACFLNESEQRDVRENVSVVGSCEILGYYKRSTRC